MEKIRQHFQILHFCSTLGSVSYIDKIIQFYARSLDKLNKGTYELFIELSCSDSDSISVIRAKNRVDCIYPNYL